MRLRIKVPMHVVVDVDPDGSVTYAPDVDGADVLAAIRKHLTTEKLRLAYAHATRSRVGEGLVRVDRGSAWDSRLAYGRFVRSTKRHHLIQIDGREFKYRRDNGTIVGGAGAYHSNRIRREDLDALNAGNVKAVAK